MIRLKSRHAGETPSEPVQSAIVEDETAEDATVEDETAEDDAEVSEIGTEPDAVASAGRG